MRFSLVAATTLLGSVLALPSSISSPAPLSKRDDCMTAADVDEMAGAYVALVSALTQDIADKYLTDDFTDTSDSINTLAGKDLGSVTFPSKDAFVAAQLALPQVPIFLEAISSYTCDKISLIWSANFGEELPPVRGISVLTTILGEENWMFTSFDVEFNSIVWAQNAGIPLSK